MRLVEAVFWSKLLVKVIIGGVLLFISSYYIYIWFIYKPPAPAEIFIPDYACGDIPTPNIQGLNLKVTDLTPEVIASQTIKINVPPIAYVYRIPPVGETFSTKTKAKQLASLLSFPPDYFQKPKPTVLKWRDNVLKRALFINTNDFTITYNYDFDAYPKAPNKILPPPANAPRIASQILASLGLLTSELSESRTFVYPVAFKDVSTPYATDALIKAQALRIDFYRERPLLKYPKSILRIKPKSPIKFERFIGLQESDQNRIYTTSTVTDTPYKTNIRVYLKNSNSNPVDGLLRLEYNHLPVDSMPCGTYPLIKPETAISYIQSDKAIIVSINNKRDKLTNLKQINDIKRIIITRLELHYYEPAHADSYLQPVYVIYGDVQFKNTKELGEIVLYVPAIEKTSL